MKLGVVSIRHQWLVEGDPSAKPGAWEWACSTSEHQGKPLLVPPPAVFGDPHRWQTGKAEDWLQDRSDGSRAEMGVMRYGNKIIYLNLWFKNIAVGKAGGLCWKCQRSCCFPGFILKSGNWECCSA